MSLVTQTSSKDLQIEKYAVRGKTKVRDNFGNHAVSYKLFFKEKGRKDIFLVSNMFQIKETTELNKITDEMCILFSLDFLRANYVN